MKRPSVSAPVLCLALLFSSAAFATTPVKVCSGTSDPNGCACTNDGNCSSTHCKNTSLGGKVCCSGSAGSKDPGASCNQNTDCKSCACANAGSSSSLCCDVDKPVCGTTSGSQTCCQSGSCCPSANGNPEECLNNSPRNCGTCGNVCPSVANATRTCVAGTCDFTCNTGYRRCGNTCVSLTDINNCGGCGVVCGATETCTLVSGVGAVCQCNDGSCGDPKCCGRSRPTLTYQDVCYPVEDSAGHCADCRVPTGCGGVACAYPKVGTMSDGRVICQNGNKVGEWCNFLSAGYADLTIDFPTAGNYNFTVNAKADLYGVTGVTTCSSSGPGNENATGSPLLYVSIIGPGSSTTETQLGTVSITSATAANFSVTGNVATAGIYRVKVGWANDCYGGLAGDRNLYIHDIAVASAAAVASTLTACSNSCVDIATDPNNCGACGVQCTSEQICTGGLCIVGACLSSVPGTVSKNLSLTATTKPACRLNATATAQGVLDNQAGEDAAFFTSEASAPAMVIVLDNGESMKRLPIDPGCGTNTEGCASPIVDLLISDSPSTGLAPWDPDFNNLFDKNKFYAGVGDGVFVNDGCSDVTVAPKSLALDACTAAGASNSTACVSCLTGAKGYYLLATGKRVWSGKVLNKYPPKCVLARKLLKSDTLVAQRRVRYSVLVTLPTTGYTTTAPTATESAVDLLLSGFQPNQCPGGPLKKEKPPAQYINNVNNTSKLSFGVPVAKPLATALWNAGQYLQNNGAFYDSTFGTSWSVSTYDNPALASTGANSKVAVCSTCQKSSIILITDGKPCKDNAVPYVHTSDMLSKYTPWDSVNSTCFAHSAGCRDVCALESDTVNWAPAVAAMLNNEDLRSDLLLPGTQSAQTYVISLGTDTQLLRSIASRGGGEYYATFNGAQLEEALRNIINTVAVRAITLSAPSQATLQTKSGSSVLLPRFTPGRDPFWEGDIVRYTIFSEFAAGCIDGPGLGAGHTGKRNDPTTASGTADDARCICYGGVCDGIYTLDVNDGPTNPVFVGVDTVDGAMVKVDPMTRVDGIPQPVTPRVAAVPVWSAGQNLGSRSASSRTIYTAIDKDGDGDIDAADGMFSVDPNISDTELDKIIPYLGLGRKRLNDTGNELLCDRIAVKLRDNGVSMANFDQRACARVLLGWIRGYDSFNDRGLMTQDEILNYNPKTPPHDRNVKLGDIFHSSPIRVDPPIAKLPLCDRGFHNQCLRALYSTATQLDNSDTKLCGVPIAKKDKYDAYERYIYTQSIVNKRPSIVLIGSNDGMMHAFQLACVAAASPTDGPVTYYEGTSASGCASIPGIRANGEELWAYIPSDLLPRLSELIIGRRHPFLADGTAMVRDIWVDGGGADGKKSCDEYHTIAVFGERRGGTHYTALDVTNVFNPTFRWMYPEIGDFDELAMGETWTEFLPGAPPIGPVKIKNTSAASGFDERWAIGLSGGYDPRRIRGNSLYLLDVWSGQKLWEARKKALTSTAAMDHPFAATPALVAWGASFETQNFDFNKGFFDTMVVGDVGGNVWVARFNDPGDLQTNPYYTGGDPIANNWFAARGFQEVKGDGDVQKHRPPIFSMASTVRMPTVARLRAYVGTGDRYNLREPNLGLCSYDNPLGCLYQGFSWRTRTATASENPTGTNGTVSPYTIGLDSWTVDVQYKLDGTFTRTEAVAYEGTGRCAAEAVPLNVPAETIILKSACTTATVNGVSGVLTDPNCSDNDYGYGCTRDANGALICTSDVTDPGVVNTGFDAAAIQTYADANPMSFNRIYSFEVFNATRPPFTTSSAATTFDNNRLTEVSTGMVQIADGTTPVTAKESDLGWWIKTTAFDERVATNNTIFNGCMLVSTLQPSTPCTSNSDCGSGGTCAAGGCYIDTSNRCGAMADTVSAFLYQANAITGAVDCALTGNTTRRTATRVVVPPPPPQEVVQVNSYGQYKTAVAVPPGAKQIPASNTTYSLMRSIYTEEIPRNVHECRHVVGGTCRP